MQLPYQELYINLTCGQPDSGFDPTCFYRRWLARLRLAGVGADDVKRLTGVWFVPALLDRECHEVVRGQVIRIVAPVRGQRLHVTESGVAPPVEPDLVRTEPAGDPESLPARKRKQDPAFVGICEHM